MTVPRPVPTPRQPAAPRQQPNPRQQPTARPGGPPLQPPSYGPSPSQEPWHQQAPPPPLQPPPQQPPPLQPPPFTSQPASETRPPEPPPSTRQRRLGRSQDDRVIAGVCGGIAAYLGSDATWVRIAWVIVTLLTSALPMVVIYILLAAVLPTAPSTRGASEEEPVGTLQERPRSQEGARLGWPVVFGVLLLAVGGMLLVAQYVPLEWEVLWPVSLIALGMAVLVMAMRPRFGGRR